MAWRRESAITEDGGDVEEAAEEVEAVEFYPFSKHVPVGVPSERCG